MNNTILQLLRFCIVGTTNTVIDFLLYYFLTRYFGFTGDLIYFAKGIAVAFAVLNSFFLNRVWTFKQTANFKWMDLLKYYLTVGSGIFISMGVHFIVIQIFGINDIISSLIASGFTAIWGFNIARKFIFRSTQLTKKEV